MRMLQMLRVPGDDAVKEGVPTSINRRQKKKKRTGFDRADKVFLVEDKPSKTDPVYMQLDWLTFTSST